MLLGDGTVRCAGSNDHGQLGIGHFDGDKHPLLTPVPGLGDVAQIAAGWTHTCAVSKAGDVSCWGDDLASLAGASRRTLQIGWGTPRVMPIAGVKARLLALGGYLSVAVNDEGGLLHWGEDAAGPDRCRTGEGPARPCARSPVAIASPSDLEEVAVNGQATCVRTRAGAVHCRGYDFVSPDFRTSDTFEPVAGIRNATTIALGDDHACAAVRGGPVLCWGRNDEGQLGNAERDESYGRHPPTPVVGLRGDDVQPFGLALAFHRSCAALRDGSVHCWGANVLPDGSFDSYGDRSRFVSRPVRIPGLSHIERIATAGMSVCALSGAGRAFCWGENEHGEVADGTREMRPRPVPIAFVAPSPAPAAPADRSVAFTSIEVSSSHSCATARDGKLRCWGSNVRGELGLGTADSLPHAMPVVVPGLSEVSRVAVADRRTCAVDRSTGLHCWGDGSWGALGTGATDDRAAPTRVGLSGVADVAMGFLHACALGTDGSVRCWGEAGRGQLGLDPKGCPYTPPDDFGLGPLEAPSCLLAPGPVVPKVPAFEQLVTSFNQACAVGRSPRAVCCWGSPDPARRQLSARLATVSDPVAIRAGDYHACALSRLGEIWCWGKSSYGELATGKLVDLRSDPVKVRGVAGATRLWAGGFASCAGFADGSVRCWGLLPALGQRSGPMLQPTPIAELADAVDADFSMGHGCALWADGVVRCWGSSSSGAHGGERMRQTTPTALRLR